MTSEYELELEAQQRHSQVAKQLKTSLEVVGWKVASSYGAVRGSVYLKIERVCDGGCYKVRIADHEETSSSHSHPDFQLLCLGGKCDFDFADIANEIEQRAITGDSYTEFEGV